MNADKEAYDLVNDQLDRGVGPDAIQRRLDYDTKIITRR